MPQDYNFTLILSKQLKVNVKLKHLQNWRWLKGLSMMVGNH